MSNITDKMEAFAFKDFIYLHICIYVCVCTWLWVPTEVRREHLMEWELQVVVYY